MANHSKYTIEDFLQDSYFKEWVISPTNENDKYWNEVISAYPQKFDDIKLAATIIKSFHSGSDEVDTNEIEHLWGKIEAATSSRNFFYYKNHIAASIAVLLLFFTSWMIYQYFPFSDNIDYSQIPPSVSSEKKVSLILADNTEIEIDDTESNLTYNQDGKLIVNSAETIEQPRKSGNSPILNQIIVPFGKRSNITFPDGTKIWINSGSRAIYPVQFDSKIREIFVEGEAYLEVARDDKRPFIVKTGDIDIRVIGTSFNVNSYPDDQDITVVLVKGSIKIKSESQKEVKVLPNQAFRYSRAANLGKLEDVDIYNYITWKEGWLRCDSEEIGTVIGKLSKYYNQKFIFTDETLKTMHLSGKLDLKEDLDEVLKVVSLTAPIEFDIDKDVIQIRKHNKQQNMDK